MTGEEMKAVRVNLSLTMKQLAEFLGVTEGAISRLEAGERKVSGPVARLVFLLQQSKGRLFKKPPWDGKF
jgi:transcriptional regulator with XRE-family HTH domain